MDKFFKMLGFAFIYIVSTAKTDAKKNGVLISQSFFLLKFYSKVLLYLIKSNLQPWVKYFCPMQFEATSYSLKILD